jgi:hypothetical protein
MLHAKNYLFSVAELVKIKRHKKHDESGRERGEVVKVGDIFITFTPQSVF